MIRDKNTVVNLVKLVASKVIFKCSILIYRFKLIGVVKGSKVLLYTDSRGTEVLPSWKQRNPLYSYLNKLGKYDFDYQFCPHKFTSILDFLEYYEKSSNVYKHVILHTGIVDFAPRPESSYRAMYETKSLYIKNNGWQSYFENRTDYQCGYEGERTISFFSEKFLAEVIIPKLKEINALYYVGINPVLSEWDGNYWRKRPSCINSQLVLDALLRDALSCSIDLSSWNSVQIKKYSSDNVHYNKIGLDHIGIRISEIINKNGSR